MNNNSKIQYVQAGQKHFTITDSKRKKQRLYIFKAELTSADVLKIVCILCGTTVISVFLVLVFLSDSFVFGMLAIIIGISLLLFALEKIF